MDTDKQTLADHAVLSNECVSEVRNRRRGADRRKFDDPDHKGPERRRLGRRRLSDEIESLFVRLGYFLCRHHIKALAAVLVIVALFAVMIPQITVDTSSEALLHADDPILQEYNRFRDRFGRSDLIIIAVQPDEVFSPDFAAWLGNFHEALEEGVPHIKDVTSLINARNTYGSGDELVVEDLLEDWESRAPDWRALKQRVLSNPFYVGNIISADGRIAAVVMETMASVAETQTEEDILDTFDEGQVISRRWLTADWPSPGSPSRHRGSIP